MQALIYHGKHDIRFESTADPKLEAVSGGKAIASWELGELEDIYMTGCRSIFGIEKGE